MATLKTSKIEKTVVDTYQKIEDTVVGTYQKIEDTVVGAYQKIEDKFVEKFLDTESDDKQKAMRNPDVRKGVQQKEYEEQMAEAKARQEAAQERIDEAKRSK